MTKTPEHMQVTVSNVSEQLFSGAAIAVSVPGIMGMMTVLPHHEPLITLLNEGTICVRVESGDDVCVDIKGGILETSGNKVIVLV